MRSRLGLAAAAVLAALPLLIGSGLVLTLAAQVAATAVVCLGLALLMGQGGLYSFGQAVFAGLGGYAALHVLNGLGPLPVAWVLWLPLLGALAGAAAAALLGALATRQGHLAFAMITLAFGELLHALALMWPAAFGGEGGIRADRAAGAPLGPLDLASPSQVYGFTLAWALLAVAACRFLRDTPFGLLLRAVRDQPQRAAGLGHSPQRFRWLAFTLAGALAGLGGALLALQFEAVSAEALSTHRSGLLLLFTFVGGTAGLAGPLLGALLLVFTGVWLSAWTPAWGLYVGLLFLFAVVAAPQGLASLRWRRPRGRDAALLLAAAGAVVLVEMLYHRQLDAALGPLMQRGPWQVDTAQAGPWLLALAALLVGAWMARRR
jgi:branched-chain amino acid transport system permease protein